MAHGAPSSSITGTNHETTDLTFWEKKERIGSYDVFLGAHESKQFDFPRLLRDSLHQQGLGVYDVPIINWITLKGQIADKSSKALHQSRVAIIVFSKDYADSAIRLKELVQILECFKGEDRLIYPVFYDVDPLEAQNQIGRYAELEEKFKDQVEEWRLALSQAAQLPGYYFQPRTMNEDECIGAIVERVTAWMNEKEKYWVWEKGEMIGSGTHGNVYVAYHWKTRAICGAVKELNIYRPDAYKYIRQEIKFLSQLKKHPNIVEYYGHNEDGGRISIYMEYIQTTPLEKYGSLKKYISKSEGGKLDEPLVQNFTAQILFGLVHLHSNRQVHRDLKPANILVNSKNIVKLVDFGLAKLIEESEGMHSVWGTQLYAAPEVAGKQNYQRLQEAVAADIWSLGCVIIEMYSGSPPAWSTFDLHPCIPEKLCQEGKDFLKQCFKRELVERSSAKELLEDPFVKTQVVALKNTDLYKD